jgi:hypothetical protein
VQDGLGRLSPFTGQNDTRAAFQRLAEVLQRTELKAAPGWDFMIKILSSVQGPLRRAG